MALNEYGASAAQILIGIGAYCAYDLIAMPPWAAKLRVKAKAGAGSRRRLVSLGARKRLGLWPQAALLASICTRVLAKRQQGRDE